jgi:hypothetical protein
MRLSDLQLWPNARASDVVEDQLHFILRVFKNMLSGVLRRPVNLPPAICFQRTPADLVSKKALAPDIARVLTTHPSPPEQILWDIQGLWLLPQETRRWRHAECRLQRRHVWQALLPFACTVPGEAK